MPRSRPRIALLLALLLTSSAVTPASEVGLLPPSARLDGPNARQRFLVEDREGGAWVGDRSPASSFAIDNPRVATVSADGTVTPGAYPQTSRLEGGYAILDLPTREAALGWAARIAAACRCPQELRAFGDDPES